MSLALRTSPLGLPLGALKPRVETHPDYVTSYGPEAAELMRRAGQPLDPWQQDSITLMLAVRSDGKWACFECAEIVARQNGKGGVLEARVLAGLFLLGERLIMWSAHEYKTAMEAYLRVRFLVQNLIEAGVINGADVKFNNTNGEEGIEILSTGQRLKFIARSKSSGRGFSGDLNIIDEAFAYTLQQQAALMPTMSARPNPQIIYTSSPPLTGDTGEVMYALRKRGEAGGDDSLCWRDWGLAGDLDFLDGIDLDDLANWAASNPSLGIRIMEETIRRERQSMSAVDFARERCGIWPAEINPELGEVDPDLWRSRGDPESRRTGAIAIALDITPERDRASIAIAGLREDGRMHWEVIDDRPGISWCVPRLVALKAKHDPVAIAVDGKGPTASLITDLGKVGINEPEDRDKPSRGDLLIMSAQDMADAFGMWIDAVREDRARHRDQPQLTSALIGAKTRPLGDGGKAWGRKGSTNIAPLVAVTQANYAYEVRAHLLVEDGPPNIW